MKILWFITIFLTLFTYINCSIDVNGTCVACKKLSDFVWKLTQNADEKLYDELTKLCSDYSDLPGLQASQFCNKSMHHLVRFLGERWNKDKVCYDVDACNDDLDDGIREITSYADDKTDCQFCIFINTKIKEILSGAPTEMEFKVHLEDMCHYIKSFESECLSFVDDYIDMMFSFIKEKFVPRQLCQSLRICPAKTGPLSIELLPSVSQLANVLPVNISLVDEKSLGVAEDPNCMICKKIVHIIQRQLQDNATDEQIINVLTEVCKLFPSKDEDKCNKLVHAYISQLIQILSQDIDPDTACILAGLCNNAAFQNYLNGNLLQKIGGNSFCVECEMIAHFIQNEMFNYKNEHQIENFIKNHLCQKMSFIMNPANCQAFVDQYGPMIMQTIAQEIFNPDMLCYQELHLCKKTKVHVIHPKSKESIKCDICQKVIKNLANLEYSDLEINTVINMGCQNMTGNEKDQCTKMIRSFGPYFIDNMDRFDDAEKLCESIDICLTPGKVHLLGGHKCTYGPSYWCHSVSHANACKAFQYCHENIWENEK